MTDTARVLLGFVVAALAFLVSALRVAAALVVVWAFLGPFIPGDRHHGGLRRARFAGW